MQPNWSKSALRNGARRTCRNSGTNGGRGTAACGCNTRALIPTSPNAFGANSLPCASSNKLPFNRSPAGNRLLILAFTTPLAVPTSKIGPKYLHCSNRESKRPKRLLDGCRSILTELCHGEHGAPSHTSFVCFLAVSTNRKPTVHAGGIRHKVKSTDRGLLAWHLNTRSWLHRQLDRSDMPFDDVR